MSVATCSPLPLPATPTGLFWLHNLTRFHEFPARPDIDNGHEKLPDRDPENFTFISASWTLFLVSFRRS